MLEQGPKALSARPQLCLEYKTHLDLHALGITALQVLADLAPPPPCAGDTGGPARHHDDETLELLWELCDAWDGYWGEATQYWQRLFDAYRRSGDHHDLAAVKAEYRSTGVHEKIGEYLRHLRSALREACDSCDYAQLDNGLEGMAPLLHALLAMISSGEDSARSSWRRVELLIERGNVRSDAGAVRKKKRKKKA